MTAVAWRTSSYSGSNGGTCVEVGTAGPAVAVRDSKHPDGPLLTFAARPWQAFAEQVKQGARLSEPINGERLAFPSENKT